MRHRVESQKAHNDQLEREIERIRADQFVKDQQVIEALKERDRSRKTVADLQNQGQEYLSQLNEYKQIIKRMSAMHSRASS